MPSEVSLVEPGLIHVDDGLASLELTPVLDGPLLPDNPDEIRIRVGVELHQRLVAHRQVLPQHLPPEPWFEFQR